MKTDLLIHDDTQRVLDRYLSNPAHALLLTGKMGSGKSMLALELATSVLRLPSALSAVTSPYVRRLAPLEGKISVEDIRLLGSFVSRIVPGRTGISRAIIIEDADTLTREAQNALLKLLEEPPENTVLLLTTSMPKKLLNTIHSRLQTVQVRLPERAQVRDFLVQKGHASSQVDVALLLSGGSIGGSLQLLAGGSIDTTILDRVKMVLSADVFTRLAIIDTELKDKQMATTFVEMLIRVASESLYRAASPDRWQRVLHAAYRAQQGLRAHANQKLVLTELMVSL
ncbi:MAG: AAA family ATPase [Candidatus Saccharimonadales bacterium]